MKYLILILLLSSCYTPRQIRKICTNCPTTIQDSTWQNRYTTYRDSILQIQPDSAEVIYRVIPCPDGTIPAIKRESSARGRKTRIAAKQDGAKFTIQAKVEAEQVAVQVKTEHIESGRDKVSVLPCPEHSHVWYVVAITASVVIAMFGWVMYWIERKMAPYPKSDT